MKDPTVLILGGALFLTDLNTSEMSPFLFIVPIVILLFIVVDVALFFVLRKKKPADESLENKEENAILS